MPTDDLDSCRDRLLDNRRLLGSVDELNRRLQRLFASSKALAREYSPADLSPEFRAAIELAPDRVERMDDVTGTAAIVAGRA